MLLQKKKNNNIPLAYLLEILTALNSSLAAKPFFFISGFAHLGISPLIHMYFLALLLHLDFSHPPFHSLHLSTHSGIQAVSILSTYPVHFNTWSFILYVFMVSFCSFLISLYICSDSLAILSEVPFSSIYFLLGLPSGSPTRLLLSTNVNHWSGNYISHCCRGNIWPCSCSHAI